MPGTAYVEQPPSGAKHPSNVQRRRIRAAFPPFAAATASGSRALPY